MMRLGARLGAIERRAGIGAPRWWASVVVDLTVGDTREAALYRRFGPGGLPHDAGLILVEVTAAPDGPPTH
jgi:hypothetical protein